MKEHDLEVDSDGDDFDGASNGFAIKIPELPELPEISIPKEGKEVKQAAGPKLYVRDDGTVDWEGALQDKQALRKFGGAVWARINGQTPGDVSDDDDDDDENSKSMAHQQHTKPAVTAKIEETPEIRETREQLKKLQDDLKELEKSHTALLNSGKLSL